MRRVVVTGARTDIGTGPSLFFYAPMRERSVGSKTVGRSPRVATVRYVHCSAIIMSPS